MPDPSMVPGPRIVPQQEDIPIPNDDDLVIEILTDRMIDETRRDDALSGGRLGKRLFMDQYQTTTVQLPADQMLCRDQ